MVFKEGVRITTNRSVGLVMKNFKARSEVFGARGEVEGKVRITILFFFSGGNEEGLFSSV